MMIPFKVLLSPTIKSQSMLGYLSRSNWCRDSTSDVVNILLTGFLVPDSNVVNIIEQDILPRHFFVCLLNQFPACIQCRWEAITFAVSLSSFLTEGSFVISWL